MRVPKPLGVEAVHTSTRLVLIELAVDVALELYIRYYVNIMRRNTTSKRYYR